MTKKLTDLEILKSILTIRKNEKKLTLKILEYLEVVDKRYLYTEVGCTSLFSYCTDILDYSKAEAVLRVLIASAWRKNILRRKKPYKKIN